MRTDRLKEGNEEANTYFSLFCERAKNLQQTQMEILLKNSSFFFFLPIQCKVTSKFRVRIYISSF
jgi:hypothetical protein